MRSSVARWYPNDDAGESIALDRYMYHIALLSHPYFIVCDLQLPTDEHLCAMRELEGPRVFTLYPFFGRVTIQRSAQKQRGCMHTFLRKLNGKGQVHQCIRAERKR